MSKTIIGVMGPGDGATKEILNQANTLGRLIGQQDWTLLTGGRNVGVMDAASKGAKQTGGLTIGILPFPDKSGASEYLDIAICTGMGSARNNINVLSADVIVACGSGAGTASEIMLALKAQKPLILLNPSEALVQFIDELDYPSPERCSTTKETILLIKDIL